MQDEYKHFLDKQVTIITVGRLTNSDMYNVGDSLQLEGILSEESDTQIYLKDLHAVQFTDEETVILSEYGAISKDKIISVYISPPEE